MNFLPLRIHMVILETHGDCKYHTDVVDEQHIRTRNCMKT